MKRAVLPETRTDEPGGSSARILSTASCDARDSATRSGATFTKATSPDARVNGGARSAPSTAEMSDLSRASCSSLVRPLTVTVIASVTSRA
jgi:hypothetical protein